MENTKIPVNTPPAQKWYPVYPPMKHGYSPQRLQAIVEKHLPPASIAATRLELELYHFIGLEDEELQNNLQESIKFLDAKNHRTAPD